MLHNANAQLTRDHPAAKHRAKPIFYGWLVTAGSFAVTYVGFGCAHTFSAFFDSLARNFHASRGSVSLAFSLAGFLYFTLGIVSGPLADRWRSRRDRGLAPDGDPPPDTKRAKTSVSMGVAVMSSRFAGLYVARLIGSSAHRRVRELARSSRQYFANRRALSWTPPHPCARVQRPRGEEAAASKKVRYRLKAARARAARSGVAGSSLAPANVRLT